MSRMMKAVVIEAYGDNDVVQYVDVEQPQPGPGEVLVKVRAAGVNPVDWKIRDGAGQRLGMTLPIRLGGEVSGVVEAMGADVETLREGDAVFGIIPSGGFADYVVAKAANLVRKPDRLGFIEAAAVPLGALTAWQGMFDHGGLESGQRLLITGSAGGVGSLAVQLAKARGAHITAMASGPNEAYVRGLGADVFIDYTTQRFEDVAREMDVVFDTVGGEVFERAMTPLRSGGVLVTAVALPGETVRRPDVRIERVYCKPDAEELVQIRDLAEAGRLTPHVAVVMPLADIRKALDLSQAGRTRGKIVVEPA